VIDSRSGGNPAGRPQIVFQAVFSDISGTDYGGGRTEDYPRFPHHILYR
jgi:hypothetical protein